MLSKGPYLNRNILLTTLDSLFLDNQYVFPYLGILYLAGVGQRLGLYPVYLNYQDYPLADSKFDESNFFYTDEFKLDGVGGIGPQMYRRFDLIGISCQTPQGAQAYRLLRTMKRINPNITVIIGGPHATYYTQECINQGFDAVCVGDGERIFEAILRGDEDVLKQLKHPASTDTTLVLQDRLTETEMNAYPIPVRADRYVNRYEYVLRDRMATTLVNSRGCPFRCAFCEHGLEKTGRWFSPEHFRQEIVSIRSLGFRGVMIFDDLFAISPRKVKPYLDILEDYGDMTFRCFGHANAVARHPEILEMLAGAGCVEMGFGAESASQKILDTIEKHTKVEGLHFLVENAIANSMSIKAFFMMGLPGETREDFKQTQDFIRHYRAKYPENFDFDLVVFFPYKGSKIGNAMRSPSDYRSVQLRLRPGLTWPEVDTGIAGAYKQKAGYSDIITEGYDWDMDALLLPADEIAELKEQTMALSGRYTNNQGNRMDSPLVEGSIGAKVIERLSPEDGPVTASQIAEFVEGVDGWLTRGEGRTLFDLARLCKGEGVIVEIGSWKGKSTIWLAHGTKQGQNVQIYAIDPHTGSGQTQELVGQQWTYPEFIANLNKAGIEDIVESLVMTSEEAARDFDKPVELVFIDGDHAYEMVKLDFELWFPKLMAGGVMAFHDAYKAWPGPERVVQECLHNSAHFTKVTTVGSLVFATKVMD